MLILGAARQGLALARYLARHGAIVTVNDQHPAEQMSDASQAMKAIGVLCVWGSHPLDLLDLVDLVCLSGGVPLTNPIVVDPCGTAQPEVEDLHLAAESDEDVGGLDVAMDYAFGMGSGESVGCLHRDVELLVELHEAILAAQRLEALLEALAIKFFHDDERVAVVVVDVVDGADVRMTELRGGPRLARKTLERARVFYQVVGDEFERDVAHEACVLRLIDHPHAAAPKLREHAVMRHGLANQVHAVSRRSSSCGTGSPAREAVMVGGELLRVNQVRCEEFCD